MPNFDPISIRNDFPILQTQVYGKPLVYFDNAATTQKPQVVIDVLNNYYTHQNSNIHRGVHYLSQEATTAFEKARESVRGFINAKHTREVIFTRGTTESINLVASSFGKRFLKKGDNIIISAMEHHSNIVPWQMICEEQHAELKIIPIDENGDIMMDEFEKLITDETRLVAVTHISNVLGTINPIKKIIKKAHQFDVPVLIDGAQGISHTEVDVQALNCDFYCFSGHKMYAPMGVGVLYGKEFWLDQMPPYQGGGEMIKEVTFKKTTYNELPYKFEAGTPNVGDVLGLEAAIQYVQKLTLPAIAEYENTLLQYATSRLSAYEDITIIGNSKEKASVLSFLIEQVHPYDAGVIIDKMGIAIRTGHHCAQPLMDWLNISGTMRASFAFYNTKEEIDKMMDAVVVIRTMFL
ncbi:MAG: cysteine desulfurase [Bacteroidota bacterium]